MANLLDKLRRLQERKGWKWLKNSDMKRETDTLILAAQEQAIRINVIKAKIEKTYEDSKCRMYSEADETINRLQSECRKMKQTDYKHARVGRRIYWEIYRKYGVHASERWYNHEPESVLENVNFKVL